MVPVVLGAAAGYAAAVGTLFALQDRLVFRAADTPPPARRLPPGTQRWQIEVARDTVIRGVHLRPRAGDGGAVMLGFGGNAANAQDLALFLHERLVEQHVVVFHYRGYAPSQGRPSEAALTGDALTIFDETAARLGGLPAVALGFSLGSGVAAHLAAERPVQGAVLVTPFDSVLEVARQRHWWAPVRPLLRHRFESHVKLRGKPVPVAVLAAERDEVVPPERTAALLRELPRTVFHRTFAGASHASLYDAADFTPTLRAAVAAVQQAATGGLASVA